MRLEERKRALGLFEAGQRAVALARLLDFAKSTISRIMDKVPTNWQNRIN